MKMTGLGGLSLLLAFVLVIVLSTNAQSFDDDSIIALPNGTINGAIQLGVSVIPNITNDPFFQGRELRTRRYMNIPYAEPPVGDLRFKPPAPLRSGWSGTRDAKTPGNQCMQDPTADPTIDPSKLSEDCLYLNIYTPMPSNESKAVMIWIHGGGYSTGTAQIYDSTLLTLFGDVVIVTVNYRLGVLGFMSTGDERITGNQGLLDQQMAFRWVMDNIAIFGGDTNRITIFGESAGGAGVTTQALAPSNSGLFHHVIAESGSAMASWAFDRDVDRNTKIRNQGASLGCEQTDVDDVIQCMRDLPMSAFNVTADVSDSTTAVSWLPVIDGTFIIEDPLIAGENRAISVKDMLKSIDLMTGVNDDDGYSTIYRLNGYPADWSSIQAQVAGIEDYSIGMMSQSSAAECPDVYAREVKQQYYGTENLITVPNDQLVEKSCARMTDSSFLIPQERYVRAYTDLGGSPYVYYFTHAPMRYPPKPSFVGADHADEIMYVFGDVMLGVNQLDKQVSMDMMNYWTNFAKTGNPNGPSTVPVDWPSRTVAAPKYIQLEAPMSVDSVKSGVINPDYVDFWLDTLPGVISTCGSPSSGQSVMKPAINIILIAIIFNMLSL